MDSITVLGAGLAGCEAAWQIARRGIKVNLIEMKPTEFTPAHKNASFAELVCSNSLKASRVDSAAGLLKQEMRSLHSLLLEVADDTQVSAGGALAVDRDIFAQKVTDKINSHPNITVINSVVQSVPDDGIVIVATGPLTQGDLADDIKRICGLDSLSFFDAAAPIVTYESIDMESAFYASRYDKGEKDAYINCPMNQEEYEEFYDALINAEIALLKDFDKDKKVYEGCMPVEVMAKRGKDTLRFGPLKPVGLRDPRTGHRPWAVVQLRRENAEGTLYNLVGFQTNLKFPEQRRVFAMIPALKNAEFMRYGVMHRNTFLNAPKVLNGDYSLISDDRIFFAGQITGVEGYMESAGSGLIAGINAVNRLKNKDTFVPDKHTMLGALSAHICDDTVKNYQPMGANFGILPPLDQKIRDKRLRYAALADRALDIMQKEIQENGEWL